MEVAFYVSHAPITCRVSLLWMHDNSRCTSLIYWYQVDCLMNAVPRRQMGSWSASSMLCLFLSW